MARTSSSRSSKARKAAASPALTRTGMVWVGFLGAMTIVGGLLILLDPKPVVRNDGFSLSPLAAATTVGTPGDPIAQTRAPITASRWQAIVIHHSGSVVGSPASIEKLEQSDPAAQQGHHFIIGNGNGMGDGELHISHRWLDQLAGDHATKAFDDYYNKSAISICLVGDGNRRGFTQEQTRQLKALVDSLCRHLNLPADRVVLYSDVVPGNDPGKLYPANLFGLKNAQKP
jgi:hypothetical protein